MIELSTRSLGFRLLSVFVLIILFVLSAFTLYSVRNAEREVRNELMTKGELLVNLLSTGSRVGVFAENEGLLRDVASGIAEEPDVLSVEIWNAEGKSLYRVSKGTQKTDAPIEGSRKRGPAGAGEAGMSVRETRGSIEFTRQVTFRLYPNEERSLYFEGSGSRPLDRVIGRVKIVLDKSIMNEELVRIPRQNAFIALIFLGASIAAVYISLRRITQPLDTLARHVAMLGRGGDVAHVPVESGDEIGRLAKAFNTMLNERRAAERTLQKILMDIHDGIGGITTNISMLAEVAQKVNSSESVHRILSTILNLSQEGMREIRSLMVSLDSKDLNWGMFAAELRKRGESAVEAQSIAFEMSTEIERDAEPPGSILCLNLFRIYREALTNILKHSKAKRISVDLHVGQNRLLFTVKDDGQGCGAAVENGTGRGLPNMKARSEEIGGTVKITSEDGTSVTVEVPLSRGSLS